MKNPRPAAFSLIEVLVVMTVLSVVLGMVATTLATMFRTDRAARQRTVWLSAVNRLSVQFRSDAHAAREASISDTSTDAASSLEMLLDDDRRVRYQVEANTVRRELLEEGSVQHRDSWILPAEARLAVEERDGMTVASLVVPLNQRPQDAAPERHLTIESWIGMHHAEAN